MGFRDRLVTIGDPFQRYLLPSGSIFCRRCIQFRFCEYLDSYEGLGLFFLVELPVFTSVTQFITFTASLGCYHKKTKISHSLEAHIINHIYLTIYMYVLYVAILTYKSSLTESGSYNTTVFILTYTVILMSLI